jgi:hypothetical protein
MINTVKLDKFNVLTSPIYCLVFGYSYLIILAIIFYKLQLFGKHHFFNWGVPLTLFGNDICEQSMFYLVLLTYFVHQLINNWVNNVTYPWIINCVQDPKCKKIGYTSRKSIFIVNLFSMYSELDMLFIIGGATSQISIFTAIVVANVITTTVINWQHIKNKNQGNRIPLLLK